MFWIRRRESSSGIQDVTLKVSLAVNMLADSSSEKPGYSPVDHAESAGVHDEFRHVKFKVISAHIDPRAADELRRLYIGCAFEDPVVAASLLIVPGSNPLKPGMDVGVGAASTANIMLAMAKLSWRTRIMAEIEVCLI
jgi:hypothetical protein